MNLKVWQVVVGLAVSGPVACQLVDRDSSLVVATRGTASITIADFDSLLASIPPAQRADVVSSPKRLEQILDSRLLAAQLSDRGRELGIDKESSVSRRLAIATEKALGEIVLDVLVEKTTTRDMEPLAKETYASKKADYLIAQSWKVRHLLIKAGEIEDPKSLQARSELIYKEATQTGSDFAALVKLRSEDPSAAQNGGEFVVQRDSEFVPEFLQAVVKLKVPQQFAPLTKTQFGYHIIQLLEKIESKQLSYEEARPQILASLDESFRDRVKAEILSDLRSADPKYVEENIRKLIVRYDPPAQVAPVESAAPSPAAASGAPK